MLVIQLEGRHPVRERENARAYSLVGLSRRAQHHTHTLMAQSCAHNLPTINAKENFGISVFSAAGRIPYPCVAIVRKTSDLYAAAVRPRARLCVCARVARCTFYLPLPPARGQINNISVSRSPLYVYQAARQRSSSPWSSSGASSQLCATRE
jgi:hypothetical protein